MCCPCLSINKYIEINKEISESREPLTPDALNLSYISASLFVTYSFFILTVYGLHFRRVRRPLTDRSKKNSSRSTLSLKKGQENIKASEFPFVAIYNIIKNL